MSSVNKVILIGRLGKDPELRTTTSGTQVANFSMATSEKFTDKNGQKQDKTEWHNIVLWSKLADLAGQYLNKGSQIYLEGKLQTRSWDDTNGQKRYQTEVVGTNMKFLGSNKDGQNGQNGQQQNQYNQPQQSQQLSPDEDPELPF